MTRPAAAPRPRSIFFCPAHHDVHAVDSEKVAAHSGALWRPAPVGWCSRAGQAYHAAQPQRGAARAHRFGLAGRVGQLGHHRDPKQRAKPAQRPTCSAAAPRQQHAAAVHQPGGQRGARRRRFFKHPPRKAGHLQVTASYWPAVVQPLGRPAQAALQRLALPAVPVPPAAGAAALGLGHVRRPAAKQQAQPRRPPQQLPRATLPAVGPSSPPRLSRAR